MSRAGNKNAQLSRNVLEMKFMKRTKEKYEKDLFEAEQKALFSTSVTQQMESQRVKRKRFLQENSYVPCADLVSGRMSFKGRNPWIEKLAEQNDTEEPQPVSGSMGGINDEDFAERYSTTVDTMSKKFLRKRDRPAAETTLKSKKFKKPRLND